MLVVNITLPDPLPRMPGFASTVMRGRGGRLQAIVLDGLFGPLSRIRHMLSARTVVLVERMSYSLYPFHYGTLMILEFDMAYNRNSRFSMGSRLFFRFVRFGMDR